jgi:integrase
MFLVLGLRKGEVLGLAEEDILWDHEEVVIRFQLQRRRRQLVRKETKTDESDATLPLPAIVTTALKLRVERKKAGRLRAGEAWQRSGLVFTSQFGTPVEPRNFHHCWDARIMKSGVSKITPHDGRRTTGTLLADLDVHPRVAMAILRHSQIAMPMDVYTQASTKATRAALKKLSESLEGDDQE